SDDAQHADATNDVQSTPTSAESHARIVPPPDRPASVPVPRVEEESAAERLEATLARVAELTMASTALPAAYHAVAPAGSSAAPAPPEIRPAAAPPQPEIVTPKAAVARPHAVARTIGVEQRPGGTVLPVEEATLVVHPFRSFAALNEFQAAMRLLRGV